ncbi:MAG: lasso peptide biosynthesis B2 protein [Candidatus Diapherotrites archaeon]
MLQEMHMLFRLKKKHLRQAWKIAASPSDALLFIGIFFSIIIISALLKFSNRKRIFEIIKPGRVFRPANTDEYCLKLRRYANFLLSRRTPCFRLTCMKRAIVYYIFLNMAGIESRLCFGVRKNDWGDKGALMHAWASVGSKPFPPKSDDASVFRQVCSFPRAR